MTCFHLFSSHHQGFCFEAHLAKTRAKRLPKSSGETVFASQPAFCTCHRLLLVYCCCIFQVSISRMFQIRDVPKWQMLTSSSNTKVWSIQQTFYDFMCIWKYSSASSLKHVICSYHVPYWWLHGRRFFGLCQVLIGQDSCNKLARSFQSWLNRRWKGVGGVSVSQSL